MGKLLQFVMILGLLFIGYDYFFKDGEFTSSILVSVDSDKREIKENAQIFMQAVFDNDYEAVRPYVILRNMDEQAVAENFGGLLRMGLGLKSELTKVFSGVDIHYIYQVSQINLLDDNQARVNVKITSNVDQEEIYLPMTMMKENGIWKVDYTSFVTGL
jgi:hypothetical protein